MKTDAAPRFLAFGKFRIRVPKRRGVRLVLGVALLIRGVLPPAGPVLLPAAFTLLSMDVPRLRRFRRRLIVRWRRRHAARTRRSIDGEKPNPS